MDSGGLDLVRWRALPEPSAAVLDVVSLALQVKLSDPSPPRDRKQCSRGRMRSFNSKIG